MVDYDEDFNGRTICCDYSDTEIASLYTNVECPYCERKQQELDMDSCGKTYRIKCNKCRKTYKMRFDAN